MPSVPRSFPDQVSRVDFLAFYWLFNMYIWILCLAYSPTREAQDARDEEHFDLDLANEQARVEDTGTELTAQDAKFRDTESALEGGQAFS